MSPHACPHCRCQHDAIDHMGYVNRDAPFYPLVQLADDASNGMRTAARERTTTPSAPTEAA